MTGSFYQKACMISEHLFSAGSLGVITVGYLYSFPLLLMLDTHFFSKLPIISHLSLLANLVTSKVNLAIGSSRLKKVINILLPTIINVFSGNLLGGGV